MINSEYLVLLVIALGASTVWLLFRLISEKRRRSKTAGRLAELQEHVKSYEDLQRSMRAELREREAQIEKMKVARAEASTSARESATQGPAGAARLTPEDINLLLHSALNRLIQQTVSGAETLLDKAVEDRTAACRTQVDSLIQKLEGAIQAAQGQHEGLTRSIEAAQAEALDSAREEFARMHGALRSIAQTSVASIEEQIAQSHEPYVNQFRAKLLDVGNATFDQFKGQAQGAFDKELQSAFARFREEADNYRSRLQAQLAQQAEQQAAAHQTAIEEFHQRTQEMVERRTDELQRESGRIAVAFDHELQQSAELHEQRSLTELEARRHQTEAFLATTAEQLTGDQFFAALKEKHEQALKDALNNIRSRMGQVFNIPPPEGSSDDPLASPPPIRPS